MAGDFIGKGWRFPIIPGPGGALAWCGGDDNIAQSVRTLLLTRLGERLMRGEFGTRLKDLVFRPGSDQNLRAIEHEIDATLLHWEPRVELLEARAECEPGDATHVIVSVSYRVRRTNTRESLVFPFYLVR